MSKTGQEMQAAPKSAGVAVAVPQKATVMADYAELYIKRGDTGEVMAPVHGKMLLKAAEGHITSIKGKWSVSASGYSALNKVASISLVTPQSIVIDGVQKPNPHIERNPKTKTIETVNVRKLGIGYSPIGNLVVVDKTVFYNLRTYLIESFQAKIKKATYRANNSNAPVELPAFIGVEASKPLAEGGSWTWYEIDAPVGIWVNLANPEIVACFDEHIQRQRFAERIAQKIVERNILKDHPAIAVGQVQVQNAGDNATATVSVYGWRQMTKSEELQAVALAAERGTMRPENVIKGEVTEPDLDEERDAMGEVVHDDEPAVSKPPAQQPPADAPAKG